MAPTTAPSSPPDLPPSDKAYDGLDDDEILKLKAEDRKAREANKKEELKRQRALTAKRKKARQESAADREAKARQLESLLAKSAVCSRQSMRFSSANADIYAAGILRHLNKEDTSAWPRWQWLRWQNAWRT